MASRQGRRLHFAYGSNMWTAQMVQRCPQHARLGVARLPGYRWVISSRGYANVLRSDHDHVEGVLLELSAADEVSLDAYEGVDKGLYEKHDLRVRFGNDEVTALVYVATVSDEGAPKAEYIERMRNGLRDAGLSEGYVRRHVRRFIPE
jgi:gamma-glutamylcyclotransferase